MRYPICFLVILFSAMLFTSCSSKQNEKMLFDKSVLSDGSLWEVEQGDDGGVFFSDDGLEIMDGSGCTVWFKPELQQPLVIEYEVTMIDKGGEYDRLSDMNVFWLASDPKNPDNLFYSNHGRIGEFKQYDSLQLHYVGMGGHDNTRTRYRRYDGMGNKELQERHDLSHKEVLLEPNKTYTVRIEAIDDRIIFKRDGEIIYDIIDDNPLKRGWFGFRTWRSHQLISNIEIFSL